MVRGKRNPSEQVAGGAAADRDERGFTLIELLVVIIILGILSAVVVFAVRGASDKGQNAALTADAKTVRTAEEAYCAKFGSYAPQTELVLKKFLSEPSTYTAVSMSGGGPCGTGPNSGFSLTSVGAGINIAANADQWITSDSGSGPGYSSSSFVYPLNSNLNEPLLFMNSDYTISGGLAASYELIPTGGAGRAAFVSALTPTALPLPPHAYAGDRPFLNPTWRFHLRSGVMFHDGQPFNADDVIWTWRDRQPISGSSSDGQNTLGHTMKLSGAPDQFDSVEKIDNLTVDITPKTKNLRFPEQVLHPKGSIVEVLRDGSGNAVVAPFGSVPGLSSPRTVGRHLDGSTGGLPAGTGVYLGTSRAGVSTTKDSPTVAGSGFAASDVGLAVFGTGIPAQTLITAVSPGVSATLSNAATITSASAVTLTLAKSPAATSLATGTPQGTGPFKYGSYRPTAPQGGGTASFLANTAYWGTPGPQVHAMNYTFIADPVVRTAGLASGQYDFVIDLSSTDVSTIQNLGDRVVKAPYGQNSLIYVNKVVKRSPGGTAADPLDLTKVGPQTPPNYTFDIGTDRTVREALSRSIDRDAVVAGIYGGNAQPGRWMSPPGILDAPSSQTNQNLVPPLTTNVNLAKSILDADGWTCGHTPAPGPSTCTANEIRTWNGDARFATGRTLKLYMVGISLVPQTAYDLLASQAKTAGIDIISERGACDSASTCPDGSVGRGQMYTSALWDLDVELPNQNDANPAFLPVLRMACKAATNFRFAPADSTARSISPAPVADVAASGGGTFSFGNTPCATASTSPTPPSGTTFATLGDFDTNQVPTSDGATDPAVNRLAAARMMAILVNQDQANVVIPIIGQYRIYGMTSKINLGDPHPSQNSQHWVSLSKSA